MLFVSFSKVFVFVLPVAIVDSRRYKIRSPKMQPIGAGDDECRSEKTQPTLTPALVLLDTKQIPHPALERPCKVDQFKVGDAPQSALDLSDTRAWDIPTSKLAGRSEVLLRPIHRYSQTADLRSDEVFVLSAHSAGMSA